MEPSSRSCALSPRHSRDTDVPFYSLGEKSGEMSADHPSHPFPEFSLQCQVPSFIFILRLFIFLAPAEETFHLPDSAVFLPLCSLCLSLVSQLAKLSHLFSLVFPLFLSFLLSSLTCSCQSIPQVPLFPQTALHVVKRAVVKMV